MAFHAVCCSSTSFTVKSTSTLVLVSHLYMLQRIYLQCESARKHVRGYPLGTCTAFSSFKCKACVQNLQRQRTCRLFCMWNRLSLSSSSDFSPQENIKGLRARLRHTEVSRVFTNRTESVPGSLLVLVISGLIYCPFMYYPSKFVCKSCRFVRDWRNSMYYSILCGPWNEKTYLRVQAQILRKWRFKSFFELKKKEE